MFNKIYTYFKNLDKTTYKILYSGFKFCFLLSFISSIILFSYITFFRTPLVYYIGINIFKLSLIFVVEFIVCGFVADKIKKEMSI